MQREIILLSISQKEFFTLICLKLRFTVWFFKTFIVLLEDQISSKDCSMVSIYVKGICWGGNPFKIALSHSEEGSTLKGKNSFHVGAHYFHLE